MSEERYYCTRPFEHLEIDKDGKYMFPCCPSMVDMYSYGDYSKESYEEIWNGQKAQDMRQSIIDGSFRYCNENSCPHLQSKTYCVQTLHQIEHSDHPHHGKTIADDIKNKRTVLDHGPLEVQLMYDQSCQLKCPSCRLDVIMAKGVEKERILELQEKVIRDFFPSAKSLFVTGSGDAFASPIFRKLLQTLDEKDCPELDKITLLTNGLLVKRYWHTFSDFVKSRVECISVSIDAASKETYLKNRVGGKWEDLLENLEFLRDLVCSGEIGCITGNMVVQENNYTEIRDLFNLIHKYGGNMILLQILEPDFMFSYGQVGFEEWKKKAVHEKSHPKHEHLLSVIKEDWFNPFIQNYIDNKKGGSQINMGPLYDLRNGRDISEEEVIVEDFLNWDNQKWGNVKILDDEKGVYYRSETHVVKIKDITKINGTDSVVLPTGEHVVWQEGGQQWVEYKE